jgi:hypothetical protein
MKDLVVKPGGQPITDGLAAYNTRQRAAGGSVVTSIVINATSLNSGGRFSFSAVELGDWYLGYFRESEFPGLLARKVLVELDDATLARIACGEPPKQPEASGAPAESATSSRAAYGWQAGEAARAAALMLRRRKSSAVPAHDAWSPLFAAPRSRESGSRPPWGCCAGRSLRDLRVMPAEPAGAKWRTVGNTQSSSGPLAPWIRRRGAPAGCRPTTSSYSPRWPITPRAARPPAGASAQDRERWNNIRSATLSASACFAGLPAFSWPAYTTTCTLRGYLTDGGV